VLTVDAARLAPSLLAGNATFVSPGLVEVDAPGYPFHGGLLVRDPDGHVL
jgi:hypothetical protein